MPWFRVDDKLHDHWKAEAAGCEAMGLWVLAGSWSADNLTDGFVPVSKAKRWSRRYERHAAQLVEAGLWTVAEKHGQHGWEFVNWEQFQPTKAKVEADRAAARERMAERRVRANFERTSQEVPVGKGYANASEKKDNPFELDENGVAIPRLRSVGGSA